VVVVYVPGGIKKLKGKKNTGREHEVGEEGIYIRACRKGVHTGMHMGQVCVRDMWVGDSGGGGSKSKDKKWVER
jgi:hypothetical protein